MTDFINFISSGDFWNNVYFIAKLIFTILSIILLGGIIWLMRQISKFKQRFNIKEAYQEYSKPTLKNTENLKTEISKTESLPDAFPKIKYNYNKNETQNGILLKWQQINDKSQNESEKDWKLCILEADALLDLALKQRSLPGESFKERLNAINQENLLNLNDVWVAHKIRNEIAHNTDFILAKKDFQKTLKTYKEALEKLDII